MARPSLDPNELSLKTHSPFEAQRCPVPGCQLPTVCSAYTGLEYHLKTKYSDQRCATALRHPCIDDMIKVYQVVDLPFDSRMIRSSYRLAK